MQLDDVQRAAQEQFARQSARNGRGHILERVDDVRIALEQIQLPAPAQILDVATGAGHTGLYLASLGHEVTLADIAQPMLDRAQKTAAERGLKVEIQQHAAEEFPYASGRFDLVTFRVAAHHFSSPERFIVETARVLKSGGWFLLIDGTVQDHEPEAEAWSHAVKKLRDPSHHCFVTPLAWSKLCEDAQLHVVERNVTPFKQPDLNWYFETAATPPSPREKVLALIAGARESARRLFQLGTENGKIVWWWQRLTLIARRL